MKKLLSIVIMLIAIGLISCQKDKGTINNAPTKTNGYIITDQTPNIKTVPFVWHINTFFINGEDMTWMYSGFTFDIQAPQLMTGSYNIVAVYGGNKYIGNWEKSSLDQVTIHFSDAIFSQSDILFVLNYLNNNWFIKNNSTYDLTLRTNTMLLSFHTDGDTWPPNE